MKKSAASHPPLQQSLQLAVQYQSAGQLQEAEAIYRRILQSQPNEINTLNLLGLLLHQRGDNQTAVTFIRKAIAIYPSFFDAYNNLGVVLEASGKPNEAIAAYRRAVSLKPDHAAAHYNLGNVLHREGMLDDAITSYRQAIRFKPDNPDAQCNLGNTLKDQGKLDEAISCYRHAIALKPDNPEAHNNLGSVLRSRGMLDESIACFEHALKIKPDFHKALNNLGNVLQELGRLDEAIDCFLRAMQIAPDLAEIHNNLGNALKEQDKPDQAIACFRQALLLKPGFVDAYSNLGDALTEPGNLDEAIAFCRRAIELQPDFYKAYINLGNALKAQGNLEQALASYQCALKIKPDDHVAHSNLGNVLQDQGEMNQAVECYRRALQIKPDYHAAYNNLGNALTNQGHLEQAVECYRRALQIKPDYHVAHYNLGNVLKDQGDLDQAIECYRRAIQIKPDYHEPHSNLLFCHNYHPTLSAEKIFAAYCQWNEQRAAHLSRNLLPFANTRDPQRRLKIGYVSPDFRNHSVIHFAAPLIELHDKSRIEVFCYHNHFTHDAYTEHIINAANHWIPCYSMSDTQLAQRIRDDGIDILVDLAGHTAGSRLMMFARKPAPVQVSWLGYGYTSGLTAIDYFIGDPIFTPPGSEALFSEAIYRLPHAAWAYQPPAAAPAPNALPAKQRGYVTFACLSRSVRINARMIEVWAEVLRRLPDARLRLDSRNFQDPALRGDIEAKFAALGIPDSRLDIRFTSPVWAVYHDADIVFDCFPHNSGTTTLEALWMGLPIITLADRPSVGRLGASILTCIGKPQWIAYDNEEYINRAVALARDTQLLIQERATLRKTMLDSPLLDQNSFVCDMEAAYRDMWHRWCEKPQQQKESA